MTQSQISAAVKTAQALIDQVVPGKVRVEAEWCDDSRAHYMVGHFDQWYNVIEGKLTAICSSKTEKIDRYYCADIFANFFAQRAPYMMASPEEQAAFDRHPATFGMRK